MTRAAPPALLEVQRWFSRVLWTPLDASSLTLTVSPERWPPEAAALTSPGAHGTATERLAVYNRQAWFRMFTVFGREFPLLARVVGHFRLNQLVQRFLLTHPPVGADIARACDGFDGYLGAALEGEVLALTPALPPELPLAAVHDALCIDGAFRALWVAPRTPPLRPSASDAARLPSARFVPSPSVVYVDEGWPLLELRRGLDASPGEGPIPLPSPHATRRTVALLRLTDAVVEAPLEPLQARLYRELSRTTLDEALALLADSAPTSREEGLAEDVRRWLAWGVEAGLWVGLASG